MLTFFLLIASASAFAQNAATPLGICLSASASSTAYTCNPSQAVTAYFKNVTVSWTPDVTNTTTTPTLNLGPGIKTLRNVDGNPVVIGALVANSVYLVGFDGINIRVLSGPNIYVAPGQITLILAGTCPFGFSEVAALNGKTLIGTLAANANVGTTGGSDSIVPAGTVSAPNFTGNALANHTHIISGSVGAVSAGAPVATASAPLTTAPGAGQNTANNTHTHPALPAHLHPAGTLTNQPITAGTPSGTNSAPGFTGTAFDNRSAFVRVIFCSKD